MTDAEFDVLDELYFLQSFNYLSSTFKFDPSELKATLQTLIAKGWVKCYESPTDEIDFDPDLFKKDYSNYYYLATKQGLLAHNGTI